MKIKNLRIVISLGGLFFSATAHAEPTLIGKTQTDLDWAITQEGVAFAPLEGDRFKETYHAMVRLPAGLVSPAHVKSANMFGIVVSGTVVNTLITSEDVAQAPQHLTAGSFYKIPAGLPHISKCVSTVDCVTYLYQDGAFDFMPVAQ